jgi:hypothetical protein
VNENNVDDDEGAERVDVGDTRPALKDAGDLAIFGSEKPGGDTVDDDGEVTGGVLSRGEERKKQGWEKLMSRSSRMERGETERTPRAWIANEFSGLRKPPRKPWL